MQDRFNTAAGWLLFSGVVALGLSSVSSRLFHTERPEEMGYPIAGVEADGGADSGPGLGALLAAGDVAKGEAVFAKCTACHTINAGGANGIGPNLNGVLGKPIGKHVPGFAYSAALSGHGGDWTYENMDAWLKSPRGFANGTKMSFAGLSSAEDRANLMLFLRANGGGPELPAAEAAPAAEGAAPADGAAAPADGTAAPAEGGAEGETAAPAPVAGQPATPVQAAGATSSAQPVAATQAAPAAGTR
ncbi:MAG: cytochrome c family protein [Citromicrobium sp.]|nr:MAG: cytochrome c family protein [Citromicrobium sp.]